MQVSEVLFRFGNIIKLEKNHKVHAKLQQCNALIDYYREPVSVSQQTFFSYGFSAPACFSFRFQLMKNGGA